MSRYTHRHDTMHRGQVPTDQLADGVATSTYVPASNGDGTVTWAPPGSPADILDIPTAETDDTLVLAPDGAGGVEFRAESGGGGSEFAEDGTRLRLISPVTRLSQTDTGGDAQADLRLFNNTIDVNTTTDNTSSEQADIFLDGNAPAIYCQAKGPTGITVELDLDASGDGILFASADHSMDFEITTGGDAASLFVFGGGNGIVFPTLSADPSSPTAGQTYYNTSTNKLRTFDGSSWHDLW